MPHSDDARAALACFAAVAREQLTADGWTATDEAGPDGSSMSLGNFERPWSGGTHAELELILETGPMRFHAFPPRETVYAAVGGELRLPENAHPGPVLPRQGVEVEDGTITLDLETAATDRGTALSMFTDLREAQVAARGFARLVTRVLADFA